MISQLTAAPQQPSMLSGYNGVMGNQKPSMIRRIAATFGLGALAVLFATAIHAGVSMDTAFDVQAKGTPNGNATASIEPTMQMGQTFGHQAPAATTTVPGQ
jgi:hypothetical protein